MKISSLNGLSVITSDAYTLGEVAGAHADISLWTITHLGVELTREATKELRFSKPLFGTVTVCLPVAAVEKVRDVVALNKSLVELKNLEECKSE